MPQKSLLLAGLVALLLIKPVKADAIGKEFITACTYGVLSGTIVGTATLAFEQNPGDNLNRIARGASLGLYAGILLGLYVTYGVVDEGYEEAPVALLKIPKALPRGIDLYKEPDGSQGVAAYWHVYDF